MVFMSIHKCIYIGSILKFRFLFYMKVVFTFNHFIFYCPLCLQACLVRLDREELNLTYPYKCHVCLFFHLVILHLLRMDNVFQWVRFALWNRMSIVKQESCTVWLGGNVHVSYFVWACSISSREYEINHQVRHKDTMLHNSSNF